MSGRTTSSGSRDLAVKEELQAIHAMAESQRGKYASLLPSHISFEDFKNAFMVAVQRNTRLLEADRQSFWLALQRAAGMGLLPDGREGALVIYGDDSEDDDGNRVASTANKKKIVQWMPMIRGMIQLVRNTGIVAGLRARLVYKGEDIELVDEDGAIHYKHRQIIDPNFDDTPDRIIGAYAVVNYKDGTWEMAWMSRRQIDRRRAVSRAKKGPWGPWYDEMARKTVLHHLIKGLPQSADLKTLEKALDDDLTIEGDSEPAPAEKKAPQLDRPSPAVDIGLNRDAPDAAMAERREPDARQERRREEPRQEPTQARQEASRQEPEQSHVIDAKPATDAPEFEAWAVDEFGEPLDPKGDGAGVVFHTPEDFVRWFELRMEHTASPEDLRENNMDAIGDAGAFPGMIHRMIAAEEAAKARIAAKEPPREAPPADDVFPGDLPSGVSLMPVPTTPGGKPHWPNYAAAAKAYFDGMATKAEIDAWIEANRSTFAGKAIEPSIEKHARERIEAIAPKRDTDAEWAAASVVEIKAMKSWPQEMKPWSDSMTTKTKMSRLKDDRPELFAMVKDACDAKYDELHSP